MTRIPRVGHVAALGVGLSVSLWLTPAGPAAAETNAAEPGTSNSRTLDPETARSLEPRLAMSNPCNPCGAKNPCNPCGAKNPCNPCGAKNPCNPCGAKNPCNPCGAKNPCNPCGAKNACNPCGGGAGIDPARFKRPAGASLATGSEAERVARGEQIWNDRSFGRTGLACATCHIDDYGQMNATFQEPYPHYVAMPHQQAGVSEVEASEMVNFCMIVPMGAEPLAWDSEELAALTAYVEHIQAGYRPLESEAANPCNP
jgi:hypothetical protein